MARHSVRRTLSSLSSAVLLSVVLSAPAAAQTGTFDPALSSRPVVDRLLSWVSEAWSGFENLAVQVFAEEKSGGEGGSVTPPDDSTTSGTTGSEDPGSTDNGPWIDPNG
jgi:hypothetical protein